MVDKIIVPLRTEKQTQEGFATRRLSDWQDQVTRRVNNVVLEGSGTPEGSVDAPKLAFYLDTAVNTLYIKTTQEGSLTGWVAV